MQNQQPFPGQNQGNNVIPNQMMTNNQLQYQQQIPLQHGQRNPQLYNNQRVQQPQNMHNLQQNQLLNTYINPQGQNLHNLQKYPQAQRIQNPHNLNNNQIPQNVNTQQKIMHGQEGPKTYAPGQIPNKANNTQIMQNQKVQQNMQRQNNQIQGQQLKGVTKPQKQLAVSHLNLGQSPSLEPVPPNQNQLPHNIIQNQQQQNQQYIQQQNQQNKQHQHHQQHPQHQQLQKPNLQNQQKKIEENLTNTIFSPIPQNIQPNQNQNQVQPKLQTGNENATDPTKKSATFMTVNSLANLPYNEYPQAEFSKKAFYNISGYAYNSYNGAIKSYNEDMVQAKEEKRQLKLKNNEPFTVHISYFGVFDGHGGDKCSKFLKENMHKYLLESNILLKNPMEAIREAFKKAENEFYKIAVKNGKLEDKSGSCAVISLILNDILFSINLGDSRALYSRDAGKELRQITRDHKPNDEKEKARIESKGGKVFYANKVVRNGVEVTLKEEDFGKGFTFPYRLLPGGLAVSFYYLIIYR
jgi:hypothetical protein